MLARARDTTPDAAISYARADVERLRGISASFDLVYSSLTLHNRHEKLDGLLSECGGSLSRAAAWYSQSSMRLYTAPTDPHWFVDAASGEG